MPDKRAKFSYFRYSYKAFYNINCIMWCVDILKGPYIKCVGEGPEGFCGGYEKF